MTVTAVRLAEAIDPLGYADSELRDTTVDLFRLLSQTTRAEDAQRIADLVQPFIGTLTEIRTLALQRVETFR